MDHELLRYLALIMGVTTPASPVTSIRLVLYPHAMVVRSSLHPIGEQASLPPPMTILSNGDKEYPLLAHLTNTIWYSRTNCPCSCLLFSACSCYPSKTNSRELPIGQYYRKQWNNEAASPLMA